MAENSISSENHVVEYNKEEYAEVLEHSFSDILSISDGDRDLFEELYYNREREFIDFRNAAEKLYLNGNNILVIGSAGVGKSNYVYKLFYDKELLEKSKLFPMMFDYRSISPNSLIGWKLHFIAKFIDYFEKIAYNIQLKDNTVDNIDDNLFKLQKEFKHTPKELLTKHPIIFVDDLDYSEEKQLFELLDFLSPYARDKKISILLSVRPPLYLAIQHNDFKYHFLFTNNVKKIKLPPLHIHNILAVRLAPVLAIQEKHSIFDKLNGLKESGSKYKKILKKLGISNLEELKEFQYPFTDDYVNFMAKITNGNLREVFDIAIDSLSFILDNYHRLKESVVDNTLRKVISEGQAVSLFLNNPESRYKLFDLHSNKNRKGNSIYFNVLEAVSAFGCSSNTGFYEALEEMGHKKKDVDNTLKELSRRKHRFLISHNFTYAVDKVNEAKKFKIAEKGSYYLEEVVKWDAYIEKCGKSKESLIEKINNEI